jgi:D-glycero-D-manno-heptose 1,7-bisphosphate phosphatase
MGIHQQAVAGSRGRAVFLDRDGIINKSVVRDGRPFPPRDLGEFQYVEGIHQVLAELKRRGFALYVVTNQPDVARGTTPRATVDAIHARILADLPIDGIYACCHDEAHGCQCRKPRPGSLLEASAEHGIDLAGSFMVGDRWRDIDCGNAAGCTTIFVDYCYRETLRTPPAITVKEVRGILDHIS